MIVFAGLILALIAGSLYVQVFDPEGYRDRTGQDRIDLPASRGEIADRNGTPMALSQPAVNIVADPATVATNGGTWEQMSLGARLRAKAGPGIIAGIVSAFLGGDFNDYYAGLTRVTNADGEPNRYALLYPQVMDYYEQQVDEAIDRLGYVGIASQSSPLRTYPNGSTAANVVGYLTTSEELVAQGKYPMVGAEGVEQSFNTQLAGVDGYGKFEVSGYGRIPTGDNVVVEPVEGQSYQLTIDLPLQLMQDQLLAQAVADNQARGGMAITMAVETGEVLAMSVNPVFDSNNLTPTPVEDQGNRAIRYSYEPGSVQKLLTVAAVIDQGLADQGTHLEVPGHLNAGGAIISDAFSHGTMRMTTAGVIGRSSNIGAVLLARQSSKSALIDYMHSFGLGAATGVGLPREELGLVPDANMTDQERDMMAFGQGISVTAIQEAAAVNAIANGGVYIQPTIVKAATNAAGQEVDMPTAQTHRVVSEETSTQVLNMMESVVALNPGSLDIPGYRTAAKSGTAQAAGPNGAGYNGTGSGWVMSYLGVAPAEDPQILTYVVIDYPQATTTGTAAAAPVAESVLSLALSRYGVPPSTTPSSNLPVDW
ncbi:MAG: penicillin-binding protein 2 [Propionibacteriaceae bacterium]|nr:penicillin-binding protein 2 [Propionibacteriaceae bacterium]